ncbi:hypothetical protein, partial [Oscillibacter sp.]|uniref:hypothetical protein n=1 Tax=Oscillibacter sp. TaxID=1945593 RepID=UPI002D80D283
MEDVFDFEVFQKSFVIDNVEYTTFNQWVIQTNSRKHVGGITLKSKQPDEKLLLLSFDKKNRTMAPISITMLSDILLGIKKIPFPDALCRYKTAFETLPPIDFQIANDFFLELSDKI